MIKKCAKKLELKARRTPEKPNKRQNIYFVAMNIVVLTMIW
jgi:hypothetical protein